MRENRPPLRHGDILPAHVLRDEYRMNASNRPTLSVNEAEVPEGLRGLIPSVERWAIPCDVTRADYMEQQPPGEVARFWRETLPHVEAIHRWLDTLPPGRGVAEWPPAAVHFLYFLKAHEGARMPTEEEAAGIEARCVAASAARLRKAAIARGAAAFQAKDYAAVVEQLGPFEGDLDPLMASKLAFARKKSPS